MSQADIYDLLEKKKRPMTRREIASELGFSREVVTKRLKQLIKHQEVFFHEIEGKEAWITYKVRRKMRLYYIKG